MLGDPVQPDCQFRDHAERALGADQEAEEVVPGRRLRGLASGPHDVAAGQDGLEREHVRPHLPVAHRRRSRRVRRRHATERRVRTGVDGEHQAVLGSGALESGSRHTCLDGRGQVGGCDVHDPIHSRQVERDPTADGDHVALEARACAERGHRHAPLVGEGEHRRDLGSGQGVNDDVGAARAVEGDVARVEIALRLAVRDPPLVAERLDERTRRSAGLTSGVTAVSSIAGPSLLYASLRITSGTNTAPIRYTFRDSVTSGHRGCPWGWFLSRRDGCSREAVAAHAKRWLLRRRGGCSRGGVAALAKRWLLVPTGTGREGACDVAARPAARVYRSRGSQPNRLAATA